MNRTIATFVLSMTLALPAVATAHVTRQIPAAPAGDFVRLDVRLPSERDQPTRKVVVQMAPQVMLSARADAIEHPEATEADPASVADDDGDGEGQSVGVIALVVGGLGLLAGIGGLLAGRRAARA